LEALIIKTHLPSNRIPQNIISSDTCIKASTLVLFAWSSFNHISRLHIQEDRNLLTQFSQSVLRGSKGIRDQFVGDSWVHFCNGYFEICWFFN